MSHALRINVELVPPKALLSLSGRLDSDTIGSVVRCLANIDAEFGTVVLDLADLELMDPTALHTLVSLQDEMRVRFQRLECRNAGGSPAHMLEMAGVAGTFGIE